MSEAFVVEESFATRWLRRAVSIPFWTLLALLFMATLPVLVLVGGITDVVRRKPFPAARAAVYLTWVLVCELFGFGGAAVVWFPGLFVSRERFTEWNWWLQSQWARLLLGGARVIFSCTVEVEGDELVKEGPFLLFIRHASVADTILPLVLISARHRMHMRFVLKRELLWQPALDIVGQRIPNVFVRRDSASPEREVALVRKLGQNLGPRDGAVIYPEGTRFTDEKRARALEKIAQGSQAHLVDRARALTHVLPPRLGGPLALLEEASAADVVFCTHVGFEGATTLGDLMRGTVIGQRIRVKFWRLKRADVPVEPEKRIDWLYEEWAKVDRWIDEHLPADRRPARANAG